jgi:photosystem II stability/assembly factor-like uncharacterized protein
MKSLLTVCLLLATTATFAQGWEWQNTLIQGNDLACITFSPDNHFGWATAQSGDVLVSTDFGVSWSVRAAHSGPDLQKVMFADSANGWGIAYWTEGLVRTTDGGLTWINVEAFPDGYVQDIAFVDYSTGWAITNEEILHTIDGGITWTVQNNLGYSVILSAVSFVNAQEGWVSGSRTLHTTDGGETWTTVAQSSPLNGQMKMFSSGRGWALGSFAPFQQAQLLGTTDGGITWILQRCNTDSINTIAALDFADDSTGWAVGYNGDLFCTVNAGSSWTRQISGSTGTLRSVKAVSRSEVWIAGDGGLVLHTTDGGAVWTTQAGNPVTAGTAFVAVEFTDTLNGWTAGTGGMLLHTTNGGAQWSPVVTGDTSDIRDMAVLDAQNLWIGTRTGTYLHTTDGGSHWNCRTFGYTGYHNPPLPKLAHWGTDHVWVLSDSVYRSTDGGATWTGLLLGSRLLQLPAGNSFCQRD